MERKLNPVKLIETSKALAAWVVAEFPGTGLSKISEEIEKLTEEAVCTAEKIRRPNIYLRIGIIGIITAIVSGIAYHTYTHTLDEIIGFGKGFGFLGVYLLTALVFLVTLEIKWKRIKAIKAVREVQAMAHIIDMHQLAKDSEIEKFRKDPVLFKEKIMGYLHACTALLSLTSKIGELYIEHFPDEVAVRNVNEFESVCNGMNSKIWQKIIAASIYHIDKDITDQAVTIVANGKPQPDPNFGKILVK